MRTMKFGRDLAKRGVWVAPWMGPSGEFVLIAVTRERKLACEPRTIPIGANHVEVGNQMWDVLDRIDPIPKLQII